MLNPIFAALNTAPGESVWISGLVRQYKQTWDGQMVTRLTRYT